MLAASVPTLVDGVAGPSEQHQAKDNEFEDAWQQCQHRDNAEVAEVDDGPSFDARRHIVIAVEPLVNCEPEVASRAEDPNCEVHRHGDIPYLDDELVEPSLVGEEKKQDAHKQNVCQVQAQLESLEPPEQVVPLLKIESLVAFE